MRNELEAFKRDYYLVAQERDNLTHDLNKAREQLETAKVEIGELKLVIEAQDHRIAELEHVKQYELIGYVASEDIQNKPDYFDVATKRNGHNKVPVYALATHDNSPAENSGEVVGYVWSDKLEQLHSGKWGSIDLSRQSGDTPLYATLANSRAEAIGAEAIRDVLKTLEWMDRKGGLGLDVHREIGISIRSLRALLQQEGEK